LRALLTSFWRSCVEYVIFFLSERDHILLLLWAWASAEAAVPPLEFHTWY